jgi:hypothetical protein
MAIKFLLPVWLLCFGLTASAQRTDSLYISGSADTSVAVTAPLFRDSMLAGRSWLVLLNARLNVTMGLQSGAPAMTETRLGGLFMKFRVTEVAGVPVPDSRRAMLLVPFGLVIESVDGYRTLNVLAEAGCRYGGPGSGGFRLPPRAGTFLAEGLLQAGYKAVGETATDTTWLPSQVLGRVKGSVVYQHPAIVSITTTFSMGVKAGANFWYNLPNQAFYHQWYGALQLRLDGGKVWQVWYAQGSGAPLFSPQPQWGLGMELSR